MAKVLEVNVANLAFGFEIFQEISECKPYSSYSFQINEQTFNSFDQIRQLVEWGMGKNMPKMKQASLEILDSILSSSPGEPVNLNFSEYECKAMQAVKEIIGRSLEKQKNGILRK